MSGLLRALIIEDSEDDAMLLERELRRGGYTLNVAHVDCAEAMQDALAAEPWDIVLADYVLPRFSAPAALALLKETRLDLPFIIISGHIDEETAVATMRAGAHDFLIKGRLTRLVPAVARELAEAAARRERRQALEALRASEMQFRAVFENSMDAIVILDDAGSIVDANPSASDLVGISRSELVDCQLSSFLPPTLAPELARRWQVLMKTGRQANEFPVLRPDGQLRYVEYSANANFLPGRHLVVARDVTERRRSEALRIRLSDILEATTDIVGSATQDGRTIYLNRAGRRVLGLAEDADVTQLTIADFHSPAVLKVIETEAKVAAARDGVWSGETAFMRRDGTEVPVSQVLLVHRGVDGSIEHYSTVARDISDRKRAEEELRQANSAKDRFLAVLSHELRNPLAAIGGAADVVARYGWQDALLRQAGEVLRRNVDVQTQLVNDLLDLSSIVRGKLQIVVGPLRLDALTEAVVSDMRSRAAEAGLTLTCTTQQVWTRADHRRIEQVISNLLGNAIKFTPRGGEIRVDLQDTGGSARLTVADTGIGINPQEMERLFEMFTQGEQAGLAHPGLGIGLALVRQLVELHGGRVAAVSQGAGQGSRFTVELPTIAPPSQPGTAPASPGTGRPVRVLLVDDNADMLFLLANLLESEGWEVQTADSAGAALALLQESVPDVIVSDLGLPDMDGREMLLRAHSLPGVEGVPALALTGYGDENAIQATWAAGFVAHLVKPVAGDDLVRWIQQVCREG